MRLPMALVAEMCLTASKLPRGATGREEYLEQRLFPSTRILVYSKEVNNIKRGLSIVYNSII